MNLKLVWRQNTNTNFNHEGWIDPNIVNYNIDPKNYTMSSTTTFPKNPEDITKSWIEKILLENLQNSEKVELISLETESEDQKSGTLR